MTEAARARVDPIGERLRQLEARIERIEARVGVTAGALPPVSRADAARLVLLLPALAGVLGSAAFIATEVIQSPAAAIRAARGDLTARRLGHLLRRASRCAPVEGYVVRRLGEEERGAIWGIYRY